MSKSEIIHDDERPNPVPQLHYLSPYSLSMASETETTPVRTGMGRLGRPALERMTTDMSDKRNFLLAACTFNGY